MAQSGTDAVQRHAESVRRTWQDYSEAAGRITERSIEQFSKMFGVTGDTARQKLQQSSGNVQVMLESTTIIAEGLQHLSSEWMRFAQEGVEQSLNRLEQLQLQGCRSIQEFMALQTQIVREHLESLLHTARRTAEHSSRIAEEASQRMSDAALAPP